MSQNKSQLLEKLKLTVAVALPIVALSGFVPGVAHAEFAPTDYETIGDCVGGAQAEGSGDAVAEAMAACEAEAAAEAEAEG